MKFETFEGTSSVFNRVIDVRTWAKEIKAAQSVPSLKVSNILQGADDDAKYCIVTLSNGKSATLPVSKKATVGTPITDYHMAENADGEWVVVTSSGASATEL